MKKIKAKKVLAVVIFISFYLLAIYTFGSIKEYYLIGFNKFENFLFQSNTVEWICFQAVIFIISLLVFLVIHWYFLAYLPVKILSDYFDKINNVIEQI